MRTINEYIDRHRFSMLMSAPMTLTAIQGYHQAQTMLKLEQISKECGKWHTSNYKN